MKYNRLGSTGIQVSRLCLGTLDMGHRLDETAATAIIHEALDLGINFIDTANSYPKTNLGGAERILGAALKGRRHDVTLISKCYGETGTGVLDKGLSRKHIMKSVEQSLQRLQTDFIDMYMMHHPDPNVPIEESLRALEDLVRQGKVLHIGCSNFSTWQVAQMNGYLAANNMTPLTAIEPPYNLLTRDIEIEMLPYARAKDVGIVVYSPMASELLSGKFTAQSEKGGRFADNDGYGTKTAEIYWNDRNFQAVSRIKEVADGLGLSMPQFSLAWVLSNPAITAAITGPITLEHLRENATAADITLPPEALEACDDVWELFRVPRLFYGESGDRKTSGRWGW